MSDNPLEPPPRDLTGISRPAAIWLRLVHQRITEATQLLWTQINYTGSSLTDLASKNHSDLDAIQEVNPASADTVRDTHVSDNDIKTLVDNDAKTVNPASTDTVRTKHLSDLDLKDVVDGVATSASHIAATSGVHGATGANVGVGDTASTGTAGVVLQAAALADLNQTISGSYSQSEVQDISDKVDALLATLRTAGTLAT